MTIAITGSSGFLGKALVRIFSKNNHKIICLVRNELSSENSGDLSFIKYSDKLNTDSVIVHLSKFQPDVFIHCAWKGIVGATRNETYQFNYNIPLAIESVLLAKIAGCKQWIGTGSQAEYGNYKKIIIETEATNPNTNYGKAKLAAGILALELCNQLNMKGVWNRIFSLYGPEDNKKYFIPTVINSLKNNKIPQLTKCEQQWDYLYVDDAAEAIYAEVINVKTGIFNLCSGKTESLKKIVKLIQTLMNNHQDIPFGTLPYSTNQIMQLSGSSNKLKAETGWNPKFTLEKGLTQTINYLQTNEGF
jgi:UDP-glucose 4-epimerase